jgi:hypothetical protein
MPVQIVSGRDVLPHVPDFGLRRNAGPPSFFRGANTGDGQDLTDLAAAVQLRLRVAVLADGHKGCKHCSDAAVS